MITPQFRMFYENWLAKADAYNRQDLSDLFDKFTSLYVLFNSLYIQVMTELALAGEKIPKDYKDKKAATDYVAQYLRARHYLDRLLNDEASVNAFQAICQIIEREEFHIIIDCNLPRRDLDLELLKYLQSRISQEKAKSILSLFYHIRCNLFHGQKNFEERQRRLLVPVNHLMRKTVVMTFEKLSGE
jgi:hypothetical protein